MVDPGVPDRARHARLGERGAKSFSFIALILTHTYVHAHAPSLCGARTRIYKGPRCFSFRGYSPFFKLGKKGRVPPYSGPTYQITPPPSRFFIPRPRYHPPGNGVDGVRKKIRPRWVVAEIGAARTSIRNADGKCVVTPKAFSYILCTAPQCHRLQSRGLDTKGRERHIPENRVDITRRIRAVYSRARIWIISSEFARDSFRIRLSFAFPFILPSFSLVREYEHNLPKPSLDVKQFARGEK